MCMRAISATPRRPIAASSAGLEAGHDRSEHNNRARVCDSTLLLVVSGIPSHAPTDEALSPLAKASAAAVQRLSEQRR